jgi:hypothetical protein
MAITTLGRWGMGAALGLGLAALAMVEPARANDSPVAPDGLVQAEDQTLVMPFTDVPADHWAYQALLNLAGVYGCVSGYPDGTFRGENTVTRFEFAAGMDACLGALVGIASQQAEERDREVQTLIQSMEQSLLELRQLDSDLPETP